MKTVCGKFVYFDLQTENNSLNKDWASGNQNNSLKYACNRLLSGDKGTHGLVTRSHTIHSLPVTYHHFVYSLRKKTIYLIIFVHVIK